MLGEARGPRGQGAGEGAVLECLHFKVTTLRSWLVDVHLKRQRNDLETVLRHSVALSDPPQPQGLGMVSNAVIPGISCWKGRASGQTH